MGLFLDTSKYPVNTQLKPVPEMSVPFAAGLEELKPATRMEKLAAGLKTLATVNTVIGVLAVFIAFAYSSGSDSFTTFLTTLYLVLLSTIPLWIVYGFAWALADFQVSSK